MGRVIAVSNQKGGVGKTTSVVNIAAFCALAGKKTLVIDNDPQGNASSVLAPDIVTGSIYEGAMPTPVANEPGLWIVPSSPSLIEVEQDLRRHDSPRTILKHRIAAFRDDFDLIFIDCPPNLTLLPTNALLAADGLLLPLQCEYFAMEGLGQLLTYVDDLRQTGGARLQLDAILLTMYDDRHPLARQVEADMRDHFGDRVLRTPIPRDIAIAAAPSHAQTILTYDPLSAGGIAYASATKEFLRGLER